MNITAPLSVFFLLTTGVLSPVWASTCGGLLENLQTESKTEASADLSDLNNPPLSIKYFLDRVPQLFEGAALHPKFVDPNYDRSLVPFWKGTTEAPLAIQNTLINETSETGSHHTSVIDFQLLAADQGVVKTATPGNFISLRWNETWNGRDMSTNMGVFSPSLVEASLKQDYPYLVSPDAKAVYLFLHGGGTATTGHHVAAGITNSLGAKGIAVVSIDSLFHAYGPREELTPEEYYQYLTDLRYKIAPEGTPVFIGGHSMGGEHADNLMRLSDKFGIGEAFAGYISLSTPLDEAPGEPIEVKGEVQEQVLAREDVQALILPSEVDLNVTLFLQGKTAPLAGISTTHFSALLDWTKPEDMGSSWNPALYLMGRYDALYVGREELFNDYVTALENTEVHIMDDRIDHHGNEASVGHMIFDHRMPGSKDDPESFTRIRNFIGGVIGEDLSEGAKLGQDGLLNSIIVEYYTNLAFRVYLSEYSFQVTKATELVADIGNKIKPVSKEIGSLKGAIKKADEEDKEALQEQLSELESEFKSLQGFLKKTYVPAEGEPLHEFALENVSERQSMEQELKALYAKKNPVSKKLKLIGDPITKAKKEVEALVTKTLYGEEAELPEAIVPKRRELEAYIERLVEVYKQIDEDNGEYAMAEIKAGTFKVDPPEELKERYQLLADMHAEYVKMEDEVKKQIKGVMFETMSPPESIVKLYGTDSENSPAASATPTEDSLLGREAVLREDFETLSIEISRIEFMKEHLEHRYIQVVLPTYYNTRFTNGYNELDRALSATGDKDEVLQFIWGRWGGHNGIKKSRPPQESTSLY